MVSSLAFGHWKRLFATATQRERLPLAPGTELCRDVVRICGEIIHDLERALACDCQELLGIAEQQGRTLVACHAAAKANDWNVERNTIWAVSLTNLNKARFASSCAFQIEASGIWSA
jgi:hypothetical protein